MMVTRVASMMWRAAVWHIPLQETLQGKRRTRAPDGKFRD
jgi:hypothetical protein